MGLSPSVKKICFRRHPPAILTGATQIAWFLGVSTRTIYNWRMAHPDMPLTRGLGGKIVTTPQAITRWMLGKSFTSLHEARVALDHDKVMQEISELCRSEK